MRTVLHPRDLAGCEHRLALDSAANRDAGSRPDAAPVADTPSVARRKAAAADHRGRVRDMLADLHRGDPDEFRIVDPDAGRAERIAATAQACADGVPWIWNATLPTDRERGRRGDSELLVRVRHTGGAWVLDENRAEEAEHQECGDHPERTAGYVPVIVVNHRVTYPARNPPGNRAGGAAGQDGTRPGEPRRNGSVKQGSGQSGPVDNTGAEEPPKLTTSPLGRWQPAPDRTRVSRSNRRDQLRLAQLTAMLIDLGLSPAPADAPDIDTSAASAPAAGSLPAGVIGLDADCIVVSDMGPVLTDYARIFARRQAVAAGEVCTEPHRISECRGCAWWPHCESELVERRDVSLVVRGAQVGALFDTGIVTVDELARYTGEPPASWSGGDFGDAVVTAAAWLADVPLIRRVHTPKIHRADIEVDVDMESFGESGAYLWGTLLTDTTDPGVSVRYRPFVTWTPLPTADEARSFAEFWTWLREQRERAATVGKTFAAYCYSQHAENRWLLGSADRFAGMPGIPARAEIERFIASEQWVDVFEAVGDNFISPGGKGLKRVAPIAGHRWRDPEAGGEASMDWYAEAVGLTGRTPDRGQRTRLLHYNEDDVVATKVLREWMSGPAVAGIPHVDDLRPAGNPRPGRSVPRSSDPGESA